MGRFVDQLDLDGGIARADVAQLSGGRLSGTGVVDGHLTNAGTLAVSDRIEVAGPYTQRPTGTLEIRLGEPDSIVGHGRLDVSGTAVFSGTVEISLADGFAASNGQRFEVARYGARSGDFDFIYGPPLGGTLGYQLSYGDTNLVLETGPDFDRDRMTDVHDPCPVTPNAIPVTDANGDGLPDECQCGDATGDGLVSSVDLGTMALCADGVIGCDSEVADATGDATTSSLDVELAFQVVNGKRPTTALNCLAREETP